MRRFSPAVILMVLVISYNGQSQCISKSVMEYCMSKVPMEFKELNPKYTFQKGDAQNIPGCDTSFFQNGTTYSYPYSAAYYPYCEFKINSRDEITNYWRSIYCRDDTCAMQSRYEEKSVYDKDGTMLYILKRDNTGGFLQNDSIAVHFKYKGNRPVEREEDSYGLYYDYTGKNNKHLFTKTIYSYEYNANGVTKEKLVSQSIPVEIK